MALTALQTDFKLRWSSSHSQISQQVFFNYNILFNCQKAKRLWVNQSRRHSLSCERYLQTQRTRSLQWLSSSQTIWPSLHPEWNFVCCGWICGYYKSPWKNQHLERETSSQILCIIDGFDINWAQISIVPLKQDILPTDVWEQYFGVFIKHKGNVKLSKLKKNSNTSESTSLQVPLLA